MNVMPKTKVKLIVRVFMFLFSYLNQTNFNFMKVLRNIHIEMRIFKRGKIRIFDREMLKQNRNFFDGVS